MVPRGLGHGDPVLRFRPLGMCMTLFWFLADSWPCWNREKVVKFKVSWEPVMELSHIVVKHNHDLCGVWRSQLFDLSLSLYIYIRRLYIYIYNNNIYIYILYTSIIITIITITIIIVEIINIMHLLYLELEPTITTGMVIKPSCMGQNFKTFRMMSYLFQICTCTYIHVHIVHAYTLVHPTQ